MKPHVSDDEIAAVGEYGAETAAELVDELMHPPIVIPAPTQLPRTLTWRTAENGFLIITDKATTLLASSDDFAAMMRAMVHPGLLSALAGNC